MDLFEAIYKRRSMRRFVDRAEVPKENIEKILSTVTNVPSPLFMIYPWRYIVVTEQKVKEMLGRFGQETARVLFGISAEIFGGHLWYMPPETKERRLKDSQSGELWNYPGMSSFVILPCYARGAWGAKGMPLVTIPDQNLCAVTMGMTVQNMWLATTELGMACALNAMPLNDPRRREMVADVVGLPHSWEFLGAFSFGIPSEPRLLGPSRAPLEGVVYEEQWGNNYMRLALRDGPLEIGETPKMDLYKAMRKQKPVMEFKEEPVPDWKIERILDTAKWAPNPENLQHWRYLVIRDKELLSTLADWNGEFANIIKSVGIVPGGLSGMAGVMENMMDFPRNADTAIIPCFTRSTWLEYPAGVGGMADYIFAGATGCSLQNMWLAAIGLGLGATYDIMSIMDNRRNELLCDHLGIPRTWEPLGILYVGKPKKFIPPFGKPTLNEMVFDDNWGNRRYK